MVQEAGKEGNEPNRAFYLEGWKGHGSFVVDTISRGSVTVPDLCLTVFGGLTPSELLGYLEKVVNESQNDGLMQRFQLFVYPDTPNLSKIVDRSPNQEARALLLRLCRKLAHLGPDMRLHFDDSAQPMFMNWYEDLRLRRLQSPVDHPIVQQHLSKYSKLLPATSLIFHLLHILSENHESVPPVCETCTAKAIRYCDYLEAHARRIYALATGAHNRAFQLAKKIEKGLLASGFTVRDVRDKGWKHLRHPSPWKMGAKFSFGKIGFSKYRLEVENREDGLQSDISLIRSLPP